MESENVYILKTTTNLAYSSSYEFQYTLHMRSIMHCVCLAGCARLPQKIVVVTIAKVRSYDKNRGGESSTRDS